MVSKWVRAVFQIVLCVLLLMYGGGFLDDMETHSSQEWNMSFQWTWDLLTYLIWIFIAWLLITAVLSIVLSFKVDTYSIGDVIDRLDRIEKRLGPERTRTPGRRRAEDAAPAATVDEDGDPPPPSE